MRLAVAAMSALVFSGCQPAKGPAEAASDASVGEHAAQISSVKAEIDSIIDASVLDGFGGQVAILLHGDPIYDRAAGFADNEGLTPVRADTLYQVSSMVKFFTAVLMLKAVEEGKVSLDDGAADLFPETPLAARDFTLRDMLDHRSGLRSTYAAESEADPEKALLAIAEANLENVKDGEFHYSNDAYDVLGVLLERLYGMPYEAIFREKIAAPAGLSHFSFWGEGNLDDPKRRGQPLSPVPAELKRRNYGMIGSAGLLISASDLVRFRAALNDGLIVGPTMLEELNEPREQISIGQVLYGAFLIQTPLGPARSARGAEDWGDNAYLNDYADCGVIVAAATSRGPAEDADKPLFRDQLIKSIEEALTPYCERAR
ncbi:MAG: beta-lactamase family protein [Parvularculaceae bacterium]|nr:beta-lactamase family protein [Parvularculaceae bacterium]